MSQAAELAEQGPPPAEPVPVRASPLSVRHNAHGGDQRRTLSQRPRKTRFKEWQICKKYPPNPQP